MRWPTWGAPFSTYGIGVLVQHMGWQVTIFGWLAMTAATLAVLCIEKTGIYSKIEKRRRSSTSKWVYQADRFSPDEESCVLHETVFHNGNGYIGVRSNFEEGYPEEQKKTIRGSYINGFYDFYENAPGRKNSAALSRKNRPWSMWPIPRQSV